jgi:hypothetical protein
MRAKAFKVMWLSQKRSFLSQFVFFCLFLAFCPMWRLYDHPYQMKVTNRIKLVCYNQVETRARFACVKNERF